MKPTVELLLRDALIACQRIAQRIAGKDISDFLADQDLQEGVLWNLAKLGEALNQAAEMDDNLEIMLPALRSIAGLRNRIIHGYRNIDHEIVWNAASLRTPEIPQQIEGMLAINPTSV